jgi:hypothetical protein
LDPTWPTQELSDNSGLLTTWHEQQTPLSTKPFHYPACNTSLGGRGQRENPPPPKKGEKAETGQDQKRGQRTTKKTRREILLNKQRGGKEEREETNS